MADDNNKHVPISDSILVPMEDLPKVLANPEKYAEMLRAKGINVSQLLGAERHQCFTWQNVNGETITWSITEALKLVSVRQPDLGPTVEDCRHALTLNEFAHDIDDAYAMTTDLSKPLLVVTSPIQDQPGKTCCIIIDGWHRMRKADLTNYDKPLPFYWLTPEEEKACRVPNPIRTDEPSI